MATLNKSEIAGLRGTVIDTQLDHTCKTQREMQTGEDPSGQPIFGWSDLLVDEPCHFWESSEEELIGGENALLTRRRLILKANADIKPNDRVIELYVPYDDLTYTNEFLIEHVLIRQNETVAMLQEIS